MGKYKFCNIGHHCSDTIGSVLCHVIGPRLFEIFMKSLHETWLSDRLPAYLDINID